MKRPVIAFSITFTVAIWLTLNSHLTAFLRQYGIACASAAVLLFSCCVVMKRLRIVSVLMAGAAMGLCFTWLYSSFVVNPVAQLDGKTFTVTASVEDYAQIYEENQRVRVMFPAEDAGISGIHPSIHTLLYIPLTRELLAPGDQITVTVDFYSPLVYDGFLRKEYYDSNGIFILGSSRKDDPGSASAVTVKQASRAPVWSYPARIRNQIKQNIAEILPPREGGFLTAVLLGDKGGLQYPDQQAMKKAGLSHAMAVSGMHIGFLVGFFHLLLGKRYGTIFSIVAILLFIPIAGASPSVIRAGVMYLMAAVGFCISRENDAFNALSLALLLILITNPYAIHSIGLQLSFAASLGLLLFSRRIKSWLVKPFSRIPKRARWIALRAAGPFIDALVCSICALSLTAPILFHAFGYVSVLSPLANLLTVSAIALVFIMGMCAAVVYTVLPASAAFFSKLLTPCIDYILGAAHKVADIPYGLIYWNNSFGILALCVCFIGLLLIATDLKRWINLRYALPPLGMLIVFLTFAGIQAESKAATISFLPSGSGQTILLATGRAGGSAPILIDCSASGHRDAAQNIEDWMEWRCYDRKIDTLILTAVDKTHARSVPDLLQRMAVGKIIIPRNVRESELYEQIQTAAARTGTALVVWEGINMPIQSDASAFQITASAAVDRKLIVRIEAGEEDILVLHSLTQKMLQAALTEQPLKAKTVVLSESNLRDAQALEQALDQLQPQQIILQSGYSMLDTLCRKPIRNTMLEGEITLTISKPDTEKG